MKKIWETGIILFAAMGFWGMIYPDLCFTEDVCAVARENTEYAEAIDPVECIGGVEEDEDKDIFTQLCEAGPERIRIRSRLLEVLRSESKGNDDGADKK